MLFSVPFPVLFYPEMREFGRKSEYVGNSMKIRTIKLSFFGQTLLKKLQGERKLEITMELISQEFQVGQKLNFIGLPFFSL